MPSAPGTAIFSRLGQRREAAATTSCRSARRCATLIYDVAGGIADGRELKAVIPGGSSVPALTPDQIDVALDYDSMGAIGTFFGAASLIVSTTAAAWCSSRSARRVLHARVVRQVHAVPRRDALDGADPRSRSRTAPRRWPTSTCSTDVGDNILGKVLCALGDFAAIRCTATSHKWRDEFVAHIEQGGCPHRRLLVARRHPRPEREHHGSTRLEVPA